MHKINKLDTMYRNLFRDVSEVKGSGITFGVTKASSDDGAFSLEGSKWITGTVFTETGYELKVNDVAEQTLIRLIIPYSKVELFSDNFEYGYEYLSVLKNDMLKELAKSGNTYDMISFYRPGQPGCVFRDMEEYAAVELRLYASKKTGVNNVGN